MEHDRLKDKDIGEKARSFVKMMIDDVVTEKKPLIDKQIGSYNTKFSRNYEAHVRKVFGKEGSNLPKMSFA
jgi:hypothetical protein